MWYVIWALAKEEHELLYKIEDNISPKLYKKAWIPKRYERRRIKGEDKDVEVKLFPGYVFIDTDKPVDIHLALKYEKEYIGMLKTDDEFAPVSEGERMIIERLTGDKGVADISTGVIENGRLLIVDGALRGMEKYIKKIDRHKKKAYLEMKLLGDIRHFTMGLEVVEKR